MRFLRTNTAVIITVGPFYDKTDGVTIETALTITNERITLTADTDAGSAPTNILDNVTGATSGTSNDLNYITGNDAGMMQLELAAADVNRLGRMFLSITDAANHVPVFHEFMVLPAVIYDSLILGTDLLQSDLTQILGTAVSTPATAGILDANAKNINNVAAATPGAAGGVFIAGTNAATTVTTALTTTFTGNLTGSVGSLTTNNDKTGYGLSSAAVQAIWDALTSALTTVGSIGKKLADWVIGTTQTGDSFARLGAPAGASVSADIAEIEAQTDDIGVAGAGLTAVPWNAAWDAEVQSEVNDGLVAIFLDRLFAVDYDPTAKPGTATALLNELIGSDAGVSQYTANALELAPGGGGTVDANLVSIDGDLTSGNNATLFLKQLNLQNNAGDAFAAHSIGGNGRGMNVSGNGTGQGALYTGGATGAGVRKTGGGTSGAGEVLNGTGASEDFEAVLVAANFATDALTAAKIALDAAQKIAHVLFRRRMSNVEASSDGGDTLHKSSLYGFIQQAQESNTVDNPGALTIYKTDGTTELGQLTIDTDAAADPIVGAS